MFSDIISFVESNKIALQKSYQRHAVVFHAGADNDVINAFIKEIPYEHKLIISGCLDRSLSDKKMTAVLGEEYDAVVYDAREQFNPDVLGAVSGVLRGGGYLFLILPAKGLSATKPSGFFDGLFSDHVYQMLIHDAVTYFGDKTTKSKIKISSALNEGFLSGVYRTQDQKSAVKSILSSLQNNNTYCSVLTSGRGRGKSASLGIIASDLIKNNACKILLSAPKLSVSAPIFEHLKRQCAGGELHRAEFVFQQSSLKFIAPDLLIDMLPEADVLFVDEAAAIPLPMLKCLLDHYSNIIFSTTTHGYEGTGRGFVLKFYNMLNQIKPGWVKHELHQPVRWSINDPLEKWIEDVLFLNLPTSRKINCKRDVKHYHVDLINRHELIQDKNKLNSMFSLLLFAHYRTRPSDFKYLLDSENVRVYGLYDGSEILGVLVVNQEGGFDKDISSAIYKGERRPQGSMLAQTLCFHGGYENAATLHYARIMRIAIHPDCQGLGLGSFLLGQVLREEKKYSIDVMGASFSATKLMLEFWNNNDFKLMRVGFSRDHVSASHSAVVCKSLNSTGDNLVSELGGKFKRNISLWMQGSLQEISSEIKYSIIYDINSESKLSLQDVNFNDVLDVKSFALYNRNYEVCLPAIVRYIYKFRNQITLLSKEDKKILDLSFKYMSDLKKIALVMRLQGKSQAEKKLRIAMQHLIKLTESSELE